MKKIIIWAVIGGLWYWALKQEKKRHEARAEQDRSLDDLEERLRHLDIRFVKIGGRPFRVAAVDTH